MSIPTTTGTHAPDIKHKGAPLSEDLRNDLMEVMVDENLHLPAMATLTFNLGDTTWLDTIKEGDELEIGANVGGTIKKLFKGTIGAVEPDLSPELGVLTVRAYDPSFKLHRARYRRSFVQVTDSDLATQLGRDAGVPVSVDSTSQVHEYIFQNNQTNMEFLRERAAAVGYDLYYEDGTLYFKRPFQARGSATTLEYGQDLVRFSPRVNAFEPVDEVTVRGWDPKAKRAIVGRSTSAQGVPTLGVQSNGSSAATTAWGASKFFVTDEVVSSQGEADELATSYMNELGGSFVEARGACVGNADIRPGREVTIGGVSARFNTTYKVTSVMHRFSTEHGHQTEFTVSSRRAGTVSELVSSPRAKPTWVGPVVGIVTNINDPDKLGRVKVKFPYLADDQESHWARMVEPMGGNERGFYFLPEVDDEVLVMFEHGDMRRAYIMGSLWNGVDKPPLPPSLPRGRDQEILKGGGAKVKQRLIKSTVGNMIILNDSDDNPGIILLGKSGAYIMVDDKNGEEWIALTDKTREDYIQIRSEDKSIRIVAKGDIIVETFANLKGTVKGNADLDVTGNMSAKVTGSAKVESTGPLSFKSSATVAIEATASLTIKAAMISIESQGPATMKGAVVNVEGQGVTSVKGGVVNVQGSGPVSIAGMPIKIG